MALIGPPRRPEIDNYTIKFLIGAIALSLPTIEFALTGGSITSISASFWFEPGVWPRSVLVGFLFAIAAFLLAYNGRSETDMWLAKAASLAAAGQPQRGRVADAAGGARYDGYASGETPR